jgi:ketosteroid isomerase-like protein
MNGGAMSDETAVRQMLGEYYRAFSTLSVQAVLPYLNQPALLVGPAGAIALPTPSAIEPIFGPVMEGLRTRGFGRSELGSEEIRILSAQAALVTGNAIRYRTDGTELERAGITYLLRKSDDGWKIAAMVLHGTPTT